MGGSADRRGAPGEIHPVVAGDAPPADDPAGNRGPPTIRTRCGAGKRARVVLDDFPIFARRSSNFDR